MASDDDVIFVDVVARLDESAAEEAAESLKDKFSHATEGVTDGLKDAAHKIEDGFSGIGDKFKDIFSHSLPKELEGAADKVGDDVGDKIGSSIGDKLSSALEKASIGDKLNSAMEKAFGDPEKFADKIGSALDKLQKMGGTAGSLVTGNADNPLQSATDIINGAKDMGLKIPGPISGGINVLNDVVNKANENPGQSEDWVSQHVPGVGVLDEIFQKGPDEAGTFLSNEFTGHQAPAGEAHDDASDKWSSSVANEVAVTASTATISASQISLGGISLPSGLTGAGPTTGGGATSGLLGKGGGGSGGGSAGASSSGDGYAALGAYSQGGDVTGSGPTGVDSVLAMLAPGEGVLTPSQNDAWKSLLSTGIPHFAGGTGGGDVAAPEAPSGGGGDDSGGGSQGESVDSSSDQGGDGGAPGTVGDTEAPGSVQDAADQGQGESVDTDLVDPAQTGIAGGTKTSKGIQDQSYGYGKGFQVTGQGLIGFAESAPGAIGSAAASGASAGPAPAGIAAGAGAAALTSLWNTIGQPELNEAITEGVKVGADLASAPSQEFAVGGENFQNWSQKLIGGEIGNVTNLINSAANTQAPLADQGTTGSAGQAAQPNGNNGTLGGQPSPQGTPGDPMHVSVVGGGPSGGDQSSSMTSVGMDSSGTS